jgi:hypothetical protein
MSCRALGPVCLAAWSVACGPQFPSDGGDAGGKTGSSAADDTAGGLKQLPDGTSCAAAPADYPGAAAAWQRFLDWHDTNALTCGNSETWPSYECFTRTADPRQVVAFTDCMMSDGCASISNEDACIASPAEPAASRQRSPQAEAWYQNVCLPKSSQCEFSNDNCDVFSPTLRPEVRCALVDCIEGPCEKVSACLQGLRTRFNICAN